MVRSRGVLSWVQAAVLDVAVEHPRHPSAYLLFVRINTAAPYAPQCAAVAVLLRPRNMRPFLSAHVSQRLSRTFTECLVALRGVEFFQPHSDLFFAAKHDEGIAINHANNYTVERLGVRRLCEDD